MRNSKHNVELYAMDYELGPPWLKPKTKCPVGPNSQKKKKRKKQKKDMSVKRLIFTGIKLSTDTSTVVQTYTVQAIAKTA